MKKKIINVCYVLFAVSLLNFAGVQAQEKKDSTVNVAFGTVAREDLLGAVSSISATDLMKKNYSSNSLDGLQSLIGGYNGNIWGQAPLILVDGIPRTASDVRLSEVESITVMKGANSVVLYGSLAAKGVVLITTKKGKIEPLKLELRANTGMYVPKGYPSYLNAADYMTLYNEAYTNDGLATTAKPVYYAQDVIDNTRAGKDPYRYPDIDLFSSEYLKNAYNKSDVTGEISGGNSFARYYTNFGLSYNNSLVKYGEQNKNNDFQFNVRGNIDMNLTDWLSASTSAVAVFSDNYTGRGDFWGATATRRPNWFNPLVPVDMIDQNLMTPQNYQTAMSYVQNSNHLIDGKYLLGGISTELTNPFSDMLAAGYIKNKNRTFMFNVSAKADLGNAIKGLTFTNTFGLDYRDFYSEAWQVGYAVYEPDYRSTADGKDFIYSLKKYGNDLNSTNEFIGSTNYQQTLSFSSQFNYNRTFGGNHNVTAALIGWGFQVQNSADQDHSSSAYHRITNVNLGFQAAYNYRHKYYFDFSAAEVHSPKLENWNRNEFSPTVTLGWRISNESFFKNHLSFLNDLQLTASYANLHQDLDIANYYMYKGTYSYSAGWYQWRDGSAGGNTSGSKNGYNPNLKMIQQEQFRAGFEASVFKNLLSIEANYFTQNTNGLLTNGVNQIFPSFFVNGTDYSFLPNFNYNNDKRTGLDFAIYLNKKIGKLESSLGFTGMFYKSEAIRRDEPYQDEYLNRAGKPLDSYWGYVCEGFFQDQTEIGTHAKQLFGTTQPGDLKYQDVNNDGVIDTKDQINLGHNGWAVNPFTFGVNATIKWKNLTLFALGTGNYGGIGFKNNSYYWVKGNGKYSDVVWGRWTEATKNTATYPRLTTTENSNNFQNSTFWMYKTDRFDLTRVQITYDLNENILKNSFIHALSVYVNGDNLLTISGERKLMETNVGSFPQLRFYNIGLKATF